MPICLFNRFNVRHTTLMWSRVSLFFVCATLITGCGALIDRISSPDINPLAPLVDFVPKKTVKPVWVASVGADEEGHYLGLAPVLRGDTLFSAAADGQVKALVAQTGAVRWAVDVNKSLSAGPDIGAGLVVLGTPEGEVLALSVQNGRLQWRAQVASEVQAKPLVGSDRVVVTALDGSMTGFDLTGKAVWSVSNSQPALNLQGMSSPVLHAGQVLQGTAQGDLIALDARNGRSLWKSTIAVPTGRSEIQRLIDIDADPLVHQGVLFVATYQGGLVALGEHSGTILWQQPFSSYRNLVADDDHLYAINQDSEVWAFDAQTGEPRWKQKTLLKHRELSDPVILNDMLVMGDKAGYVHFLSTQDGRLMARIRVGRAPVRQGPLSAGDRVYVQNTAGTLQALRVSQ